MLIENNYFVVQAYMVTELGLRGNELLIYAIINGFSQTEGQWFYHRLKYLCEFTQTSKPTVIKSLQSLVNKGLIEKQEESFHGTRICKYRVKNFTTGKETLPRAVKKLNQGGKETLPYINNININTKYTDRKKNSFHNFDERNTDYNALQEKLTKARFKS